MLYIDQRLSRILSDTRIEQARSIDQRQPQTAGHNRPIKQRLGLWMIDRGESLADSEPKAA